MKLARDVDLLSTEHFSVDGTLIRAWASQKNFVPKNGPPPDKGGSKSNPEDDFKRQKRSNDTHESQTDANARCIPSRTRPRPSPPTSAMR